MQRPLRFARVLAVTVALGLSLTACGDKDGAKSGADGGKDATAQGAPAKALTRSNFSERVFTAIDKAGSAKVHFEAGQGAQKLTGNGEIQYGDDLALRVAMDVPQQSAGAAPQEMLLVDKNFYISMSGKYMKLPLDSFKSMGVPDISANLDPKIQAKAFGQAVTKFEQTGQPQKLDGVQTTPYTVTFDPTKAPDVYGTTVTTPITVVYYIGPDDLLRKMVYEDKNGDFISTYSDWGAPVDIKAPPASDLMQGMN